MSISINNRCHFNDESQLRLIKNKIRMMSVAYNDNEAPRCAKINHTMK